LTAPIAPCWDPREIQAATQIDVGSWEFADPVTDAVFTAVHQPVPIARLSRVSGTDPVEVTEDQVLEDFCQPLTSNEPHLRFITGKAGTGKSHLVRLLRARTPATSEWHVVYIEKANTDLRLIIEKILAGIHTPIVERLRQDLNAAATNLTDPQEAGLALINKLHQFLAYDTATEIEGANAREVAAARPIAERLIGDYAFKIEFLRKGGPVERITALAFKGVNDGAGVEPEDLVFTEQDLRVEPEAFLDAVPDLKTAVKRLVSNAHIRTTIAALLNHYLPRAKAEVFTGGSTDLVEVFRDVRRVLARQGKELCLFIEDLVLLHVIDTPLAQALTIPASKDLCRIRAAIAVTSGHLEKYTTFADRGVHYTMDLGRSAVSDADLRDLVGRYLNVGRVGTIELVGAMGTPNKCDDCPLQAQPRCHDAFGASSLGHGYFPFNANALDRLINLASRGRFDPRNILREVIRAPLEVAHEELETPGQFPSEKLAEAFDDARISVPFEMRNTLTRRAAAPAQEITLRALYADQPPVVDESLDKIAAIFGVQLTDVGQASPAAPPVTPTSAPRERETSPIDGWLEEWITKGTRLHTTPARTIRSWLFDAIYTQLQDGPYGVPVRRVKSGPVHDLYLGPIRVPWTAALVIDNSASSGSTTSSYDGPVMNFAPIDSDGVIFKGILEAEANTGSLVGPEGGRWLLQLQNRLRQFTTDLVAYANRKTIQDPLPALQILGILASASDAAGGTPSAALEAMVRGRAITELGPAVREFLQKTDAHRSAALAYLRDRHAARKGDGAWTLLDAGAIIHHLKPSAALRELPETIGQAHELGTSFQRLREMQASASREAWRAVNEQLGALRTYIEDDADFRDTAKAMDEFAARAHNASVLLNSDALDRYRILRAAATDKAFATHHRLARIATPAPAAALLWELAKDPTPELAALREYWAYCNRLLDDAQLDLQQGTPDDGAFGRARMQSAFRELAEALEEESRD
jgi:hypothetical protein